MKESHFWLLMFWVMVAPHIEHWIYLAGLSLLFYGLSRWTESKDVGRHAA